MIGLGRSGIYTKWDSSQPQKEWNNAICSNIDGPRDYHIKWRTSEKEKYLMISHIWSLKYDTNEHIYETETYSESWRTDLSLLRWMGWIGSLRLADVDYYIENGWQQDPTV